MSNNRPCRPSRRPRNGHAPRRARRRLQVEALEDRTLPSVGAGLRVEYYDNADLTALTAVRFETFINNDWGDGQPTDAGLTSPDAFSVRWTGQLEPAYSETYTFTTTSDDGVRLWVDGRLIIDNWTDHAATTNTGTVTLVAGRKVDLVMEYFENEGLATARLEWSSPSQRAEVVPQERLYPSARGSILREYWTEIPGTRLSRLTDNPTFPSQPSGADYLTSFEAPRNFGDHYGARVRGYLHASVTGTYELYIASDGPSELWLSTDKDPANAQRLAFVPRSTRALDWDRHGEQRATVELVAGQTYYIEALHKEGRGRDHLAVGWRLPGAATIEIIPGNFLSPVLPTVRLYVDQSAASERDGNSAAFTVVRDDDLSRDLVVRYTLSGTATGGTDYIGLPSAVSIPAGARSATFFVQPIDDADPEGAESVRVTLLADARYTLATPSSRAGVATLYDDDFLPPGTNALFADEPDDFLFAGAAFASASVVSVSDMTFTEANRVVTHTRPLNNFDVRVHTSALAPATVGDTLLLTFWARNADPDRPFAEVRLVYERAAEPFTKSLSTGALALSGTEWHRFDLPFRAAETYNGVTLRAQLYFALGFDPQTVEIGGVTLINYGPGVAPEDLTTTAQTYQGRAGTDLAWRDEAQARIEENRKADLTIQVRDEAGNPIAGAVVQVRLVEHAFGFGSAVAADGIANPHSVDGPNYRNLITQLFNKVVLENDLKWPNWQTNPAKAIAALDWLFAQGIDDIRGHNLIWPGWQFMPASPGNTYGGINYRSNPSKPDSQEEYEAHVTVDGRAEADAWLRQRVLEHILEEAGHPQVRGRLTDWDVVNEPFSNHNVQDVLGQTYGVDGRQFLVEWFQAAKAADPNARLFLNDFPSLAGGGHLDAFFTTIQYLLDNGAPLEGIGFQNHFGTSTPGIDALLAGLDRFAAFGLPMQVTEFDQASRDEQLQADFLRDFLTLSFSHPSIDAFLMWGFWQGRMSRPDAALWRTDWTIKPNGQQWLDLVKAEWFTDVTGSTFADGLFRARGFLGEYEVVVSAGGRTFMLSPALVAGGTTLVVTVRDEPPVLSGIEIAPLVYAAGDGAKAVSATLTVTDPDNELLHAATVQITGNYAADQDLLEFTATTGIDGVWDAATGTLILFGSATAADYQAALRTVAYRNTLDAPNEDTRTLTFTVYDDLAVSNSVSRDVIIFSTAGLFLESGGLVVIEAENFTSQLPGSGGAADSRWIVADAPAGASGPAVTTEANTGVNTGDTTSGPRLDYDIFFTTPGAYYVWVRLLGPTATDDSIHAGLDGQVTTLGGSGMTDPSNTWVWKQRVDARPGDTRVTVVVADAGPHAFNLWLREDGVFVDRIVLTTDPLYQPGAIDGGLGPPESPRGGA